MRAYVLSVSVICLAAVMLAGCGSGSSRSTTTAAPEPAAPAGSTVASGIPGLTVADVNAMPPAVPLPSSFTPESTNEQVEIEAAKWAELEFKRKELGDVPAAKRAIFLAHYWNKELRTLKRAQPSEIPGLTIGEVDDQPSVPPLPQVYELGHTPEDLKAHAVVVALEEDDAGILGPELSVNARMIYLSWAWTPLLQERQGRYQAAVDERQARANFEVEEAKRKAQWDAKHKAQLRETELLTEAASRERIPILTEAELDELERYSSD